MVRVAIIGASGFIGTRIVESFYLSEIAGIVPIVKSYASMARLARFELDCRIADARDEDALALAFAGCDFVVHAALGDVSVIIDSVEATYRAAVRAGVKRLVYLSSIVVHGMAPPSGTDENSPISSKQRFNYNKAKVIAEQRLLNLRREGSTEVAILRPGIVYGPRSARWTAGIADDLMNGRAYLVNNGKGICNCIYVDNVVEAIRLSIFAASEAVDGQAFLISDQEKITWKEFYASIAGGLDIDVNRLYCLTDEDVEESLKRTWRDDFNDIRATPFVQSLLPFIPGSFKSSIKKVIQGRPITVPAMLDDSTPQDKLLVPKPDITADLVTLQMCEYKLPNKKAQQLLGFSPVVTFAEGSQRALGWLSFAGYPVKKS